VQKFREAFLGQPLPARFLAARQDGKKQRARLRGRGTESEEAIAGRLKRAEEELPYAREYDFSVENRDVDACADEIYRILKQRQQD